MEQTSIKDDLASIFAQLSTQPAPSPEPTAPVAQGQTAPTTAPTVPQTTTAPAATTDPAPQVAPNAEPTPVTAPKTEPAPATATTPSAVDAPVDTWDTDETPTQATSPAPVTAPVTPATSDFSDIAKVLGREKIASKDELVTVVNEVKAKADRLASLPADLQKAIEIANSNGNYLEYLGVGVIDWSKEDPITLYENYVINQFTDNQGNVDYERVDKLLDKIEDDEKELRGRDLQRQYINHQANEKARVEYQTRVERQAFEQSVKGAVDSLNDIAGFKLSPTHKAELYNYIVRGEDQKVNDVSQRVINAFITKYFTKIDSFRKSQIRNATKREILEQATVPQLNASAEPTTSTEPEKKYGLGEFLKELEKQKR